MNRNAQQFPVSNRKSVLPFPKLPRRPARSAGDEALAALEHVSRRIDDLARELKCLGHFDDVNRDRPRAA